MKTKRTNNAVNQREIIKKIVAESRNLTELLIKFDLYGIPYENDFKFFKKIYSSIGWVGTKSIIKNNDIIDLIVDEKFAKNVIYNCWVTSIKTTPYERMLTRIWLEKHPEFKN